MSEDAMAPHVAVVGPAEATAVERDRSRPSLRDRVVTLDGGPAAPRARPCRPAPIHVGSPTAAVDTALAARAQPHGG
ncbi:hypothetical protein [Kitasatospora sp. NPDC085879]|uniref:hypothetical protein n=1 Tax=Kitasatospora sp. NPDC085879 TaxID=3154769 RepID=UPI0034421970